MPGAVVLAVVAVLVLGVVSFGWPPWPHRESRDLAALESLAPNVSGGRLYWQDASHTECNWVDCPEARLQRRYLVPCVELAQYATLLGQQFERRGFPAPQLRDFGENNIEGHDEWDTGFVEADVSTGKIWAQFSTSSLGDYVVSDFSDVSDSEVAEGCHLVWTLSVSKHG